MFTINNFQRQNINGSICGAPGCNKQGCINHNCRCCFAKRQHRMQDCIKYQKKVERFGSTCPLKDCVTRGCSIHICRTCGAQDKHRNDDCPQNITHVTTRNTTRNTTHNTTHNTTRNMLQHSTTNHPSSHNGGNRICDLELFCMSPLYTNVASIDPFKNGDNNATSVSAIIYRNGPNGVELLVHKRAPQMSNGGTIASPGGLVKYNQTWFEAIIREVEEEAGFDITPYMRKAHLVKNRQTQTHHHVAVAVQIPRNTLFAIPKDKHELDHSFSNNINFHEWIPLDILVNTHYNGDRILPPFRDNVKLFKTAMRF